MVNESIVKLLFAIIISLVLVWVATKVLKKVLDIRSEDSLY